MKKSKEGMTLVEIIVAIAILGIIAISFLAVFTSSFRFIYTAGRKSVAVNQAEQSVETKIANGTAVTANSITLNFGTVSVSMPGELITKDQSFENGTKVVSLKSFIPTNSIASGATTIAAIEKKLEISKTDVTLRPGSTYTLEANKEATFMSSNTSVATIGTNGVITALSIGTSTITVTPVSTTYSGDQKTCVVTVSNNMYISDVKGGQFVKFDGIVYQKLTGENRRVLSATNEGSAKWNTSLDLPTREELDGDLWTNALRKHALGYDYWTFTSQVSNGNKLLVTFVEGDGKFNTVEIKNNNSDPDKYVIKALTLDNLKVKPGITPGTVTGTGTYSNPYILELP